MALNDPPFPNTFEKFSPISNDFQSAFHSLDTKTNILTLKIQVTSEFEHAPIYKILISRFYPFINSRLQASHCVRERMVTIDGVTATEPQRTLKSDAILLVRFDWPSLLRSRWKQLFEVVEPCSKEHFSNIGTFFSPTSDAVYTESYNLKTLVAWKPAGVSPYNIVQSLIFEERIKNSKFDSPEKVTGLFKEFNEVSPCDVKGATMFHNVEKTSAGLCLVVFDDETKGKSTKGFVESVVRYYHVMCHGRLSTDIISELSNSEAGIKVDPASIKFHVASPGSNETCLTEFRFATASKVIGTRLREVLNDHNMTVVGNAKHTRPLPHVSKRGALLALIGLSFHHPRLKKEIYYYHEEPGKFKGIAQRESMLAKKKLDKDTIELGYAGIDSIDDMVLEQLVDGLPVAYVTGFKKFFGIQFQVSEYTLIPRSSSEALVKAALDITADDSGQKNIRILDIGTGSGCLLLSCLKAIPNSIGVGIDSSTKALTVARSNALTLGLDQRSTFYKGDFYLPRLGLEEGNFDIVICNPPYLPLQKISQSPYHALRHEPLEALFTSLKVTDDNLSKAPQSYHALSLIDQDFLMNPSSVFIIELGKSVCTKSIINLFSEKWELQRTVSDLTGFDRAWVWRPLLRSDQYQKLKSKFIS